MNVLKIGSKGSEVKLLQEKLNLLQDGIFGPITQETVIEFLKANNLTPDGIVGPKTWLYLQRKPRAINSIILHCSATLEGKDYTVEDIRRWHLARGFTDIGYHYIIYRNGLIVSGRPEYMVGAHCTNHNSFSIGICYIGGLDKNGKPKDTRTIELKKALIIIVQLLMHRYKLNKYLLHCHNEYANKACPSFKIEEFKKEF